MKKNFIVLTLLGIVLASFASKSQPTSTLSLQEFADSLFKANIDKDRVAGGAVIVFQKGKMLLNKAYGYANLELSTPMPQNGVFEIGSVTKQFTAAAILKLAKKGKLSLDDDFTKYVKYDTKGRKVTINQLLNHTSGIPGYTEMREFGKLMVHRYHRDSLLRMTERKEFLFEPGKALIYNNTGYFLLGLVIEKASGKSYEDFIREEIFEPLEMKNSCYCTRAIIIKNKVDGYGVSPFGFRKKIYIDHTWPYAAGSLCSTTEDLLRWMRALHTGKVFNKKMYKKMITPSTLSDGSPLRYAMGLSVYKHKGHRLIGHGGGIPGFLSETRYFPEKDLYVICLVNTIGPAGASFFADQLTSQILENAVLESKKVDIDTKKLAGTYSGQGRGRVLTIKVTAKRESLVINNGRRDVKFDKYRGNGIWENRNTRVRFVNGECHWDSVGGYYILKKKSKKKKK